MELVLIYSDTQSFEPLQSILPVSLISIMGKPLIQHQLELSYSRGIRHCTIVAANNLSKIRDYCGDGSRFGVQLNLVTAAPGGQETESLLRHRNLLGDYCLILAGRTLANLPIEELRKQHDISQKRLSVIRHRNTGEFIGLLSSPPSPGDLLDGCSGSLKKAAEFLTQTRADDVNVIDADFPHFVCNNLSEVLTLTAKVLDSPADYIHDTHFAQQEQGIHLGHHTLIHSSAVIHPPVAIGDFCQIAENAVIGPHVTIASGSIVAKGATVKNSVVSPGSYVGEMMEVKDAIVIGATLVQPLSGIRVLISDPLLLDKIKEHSLSNLANSLVHRGVALGLLTALFPAGVLVAALSKIRTSEAIVKSPTLGHGDVADEQDIGWLPRFNRLEIADKTLPLSWYPTLLNVLQGQMRFTGPCPVASDEKNMGQTVSNTARYTVPPGLFPVDKIFEANSDESEFAEVLYTKKQGIVQDLRCVAASLAADFIGKRKAQRLAGL